MFFLRRSRKANKVEKTNKPAKAPRSQPAPTPTPAPRLAARTQPAKPKISLSQRVQPVLTAINPGNWQVTQTVSDKVKAIASKPKITAPVKAVHINTGPASTAFSAPLVINAPKKSTKKSTAVKAAAPRKSKSKQLKDVKLMGEEEHVCPYCLEKVDKNEEIVVCPECGTWHHKDCWDLTVPAVLANHPVLLADRYGISS